MVLRCMGLSRRLALQEYALCPDAVLPTDLPQSPPSCSDDRFAAHTAKNCHSMTGPHSHVHGIDRLKRKPGRWPSAAFVVMHSHATAFAGQRSRQTWHGKVPPSAWFRHGSLATTNERQVGSRALLFTSIAEDVRGHVSAVPGC